MHKPSRETAAIDHVAPISIDILTVFLLIGSATLLVVLAWSVLVHWAEAYLQPDSYYTYGPGIPFVVAFMLWHRRNALGSAFKKPDYKALLLLTPAVAILLIAQKHEVAALASFGLLLTLWGGIWLILGGQWVRAAAFPLAFLLWMVPWPGPLLHEATFSSQQLCTVLSDRLLHLLSFQTTLSGNVISMDNFALFVDEPCSGFRLLLTLMMISAAFTWLTEGPLRWRVVLFACSFPLSIADNVVRLTTLAIVGESFGAHVERAIHDVSGLVTVALGLVFMFVLARRFGCRTFAQLPLL